MKTAYIATMFAVVFCIGVLCGVVSVGQSLDDQQRQDEKTISQCNDMIDLARIATNYAAIGDTARATAVWDEIDLTRKHCK